MTSTKQNPIYRALKEAGWGKATEVYGINAFLADIDSGRNTLNAAVDPGLTIKKVFTHLNAEGKKQLLVIVWDNPTYTLAEVFEALCDDDALDTAMESIFVPFGGNEGEDYYVFDDKSYYELSENYTGMVGDDGWIVDIDA